MRGQAITIELPDYNDDDGDPVTISSPLSAAQKSWITFISNDLVFELQANKDTTLGFTTIPVVLSDGKDQKKYEINVLVIDNEA